MPITRDKKMAAPDWFREDTMDVDQASLDPLTKRIITNPPDRSRPVDALTNIPITSKMPPTLTAGVPGAQVYSSNDMSPTEAGFILRYPNEKDRGNMTDAMFLGSRSMRGDQGKIDLTIGHEAEHLLARRQMPAESGASGLNSVFDELVGDDGRSRSRFVYNAVKVAPYLKEKYGVSDAYFSPRMVKFQGELAPNLFYEQAATLAGVESTQGVDLTKDPVLRDTLFADQNVREAYNAVTGLRQTRLDAKDIRPYTRISEKPEPSFLEKLKKSYLGDR